MRRLLEWNQRVNLTGARSIRELLGEHLPDSFALCRLVPEGSDVVDVGSGGGLPAIPFSILRHDCRITLLEPRAKRVAFLKTAARECGCANIKVVRGRLEDVTSSRFDVATSRATFPPNRWLELAPSVLAPEGRFVVLANLADRPSSMKVRLIDSVEYRTTNNTMRWAGCYCST
jgi:16S rRNA (guanine527-N7)-methyltransferase